MADTPTGETVTPGDSQTTVTPPTPAPAATVDTAEVERLRKQSEQADMRVRQLENEKKERDAKDAEERQKQLEEQNEFKTLYEKTNADLQALRDTQTAAERQAELSKLSEGILKDYPQAVVDVAQTAGLNLTDDGEAAQKTFKDKLDSLKEKVAPGTGSTVTSSNPNTSAPAETGQTGGLGRPRSLGVDDGSQTIRPEANQQKISEYISKLPAIEQMKRDAGVAV
jgi:hypothetical protein